jgi:hypothetical protein
VHIIIFFIFTQQQLAGRTEFYFLHFGNTCSLHAIQNANSVVVETEATRTNGNLKNGVAS